GHARRPIDGARPSTRPIRERAAPISSAPARLGQRKYRFVPGLYGSSDLTAVGVNLGKLEGGRVGRVKL
ncbi:MAG: hypothetical protein AAB385_08165, partial [Planctomycetota bacterium]